MSVKFRAVFTALLFALFVVGVSSAVLISFPYEPEVSAIVMLSTQTGGHGTGFYIGNNEFVTAAHVTKDDGVLVISTDGGIVLGASHVVWSDEASDTAVILADNTIPSIIKPLPLMCGTKPLAVGTPVTASGYALDLGLVKTWGHVSGVEKVRPKLDSVVPYFIADITIAPGDSGGPVLNSDGEVVGVISALAVHQLTPFSVAPFPYSFISPLSAFCKSMKEHTK